MLVFLCCGCLKQFGPETMTITSNISVQNDNLVVQGKTILTKIPDNIILTPVAGAGSDSGAFIGATFEQSKSLHVFPIGVLE